MLRKSRALVAGLAVRMDLVISAWIGLFLIAALPRLAFPLTPAGSFTDFAEIALPYGLIALAPILGYRLACGSFPAGMLRRQPQIRLARYGRWTRLDVLSARNHPAFGPFGFMASLLVGLLLNVPVRSMEFLLAVPAMNGNAPEWGTAIFRIMAFEVVSMNFLYMICFVMALRTFPFFPRMLVIAWALDALFQLAIATYLSSIAGLPQTVAGGLRELLVGNVWKLAVSVTIWLPYLLLAQRVNVTYRHRALAE